MPAHDEPFAHIDDLVVGDKVYVETQTTWYVYTPGAASHEWISAAMPRR